MFPLAEVSTEVAVGIAVIAAIPGIVAAVLARKSSGESTSVEREGLAVTGLTALVTDLQEERAECRKQLQECKTQLAQREGAA